MMAENWRNGSRANNKFQTDMETMIDQELFFGKDECSRRIVLVALVDERIGITINGKLANPIL
jgi:hypothetical protein